jgi:hypothetical protein
MTIPAPQKAPTQRAVPRKLYDLTNTNICATMTIDVGLLQVFRPATRPPPSDGLIEKGRQNNNRNRDANCRSANSRGGSLEVTVPIPEHRQVVVRRTVCYNTRRSPRHAPVAPPGSLSTCGCRHLVLVET